MWMTDTYMQSFRGTKMFSLPIRNSYRPPKDQPAPHRGGGVNSQVGECLVGLCHQGWRSQTEEPSRALREVERLTRNPEKLANAGVGRTLQGERGPLGPTGLLTLPGEDWSPPGKRPRNSYMTMDLNKEKQRETWIDNVREDLKEKNIDLTRIGEATRNREVWTLEEACKSLIVSALMEEKKEERRTHVGPIFAYGIFMEPIWVPWIPWIPWWETFMGMLTNCINDKASSSNEPQNVTPSY